MSLSECASCVKFVLFAFNLIFLLIGCVLVGVGIFVRVDGTLSMLQSGCDSSYVHLYTAAYILIGVGAAVVVLGFLGCCGAMRESACLLVIFAVSLFLIFGVLVAAGVWAIIDQAKVDAAVDEHLANAVSKYYKDNSCKLLVDQIQEQLHCCGATKGVEDYTMPQIPLTCKPKFYAEPCNKPIQSFLEKYLVVVAGVSIGVGIVMLFGAVLSLLLCCGVRSAHRRETNNRYK